MGNTSGLERNLEEAKRGFEKAPLGKEKKLEYVTRILEVQNRETIFCKDNLFILKSKLHILTSFPFLKELFRSLSLKQRYFLEVSLGFSLFRDGIVKTFLPNSI